MALTARGPVEQQKQPQWYPQEPSSYCVTRERVAKESRPAG